MIKTIARVLPRFKKAIIAYAQKRPYSHIKNEDGTPYMDRWWLMPKFLLTKDENGYLHPRSWCPFLIRLHHIRSSDYDRELHDHPADYRTILLDGGYVEMDVFKKTRILLMGETIKARAQTFHRITTITNGGVWTIFIMRKKCNEWGFLVEGGYKVGHRSYSKNKKTYLNNTNKPTTTQEIK